ncbi:hypothetical protein HHI36_003576 [Cryptolaemus montrouzieri]|uniref:Uncharacterized protein n=1 Tax=Cryptolaemus montrouzieri TaxID=559131 RepID=A0ABD2PE23_9CUCU
MSAIPDNLYSSSPSEILRKPHWSLSVICILIVLPAAKFEDVGPTYDTGDWIPITPDNQKSTTRESKSSDRILNIDISAENFYDGKSHRRPSFVEHRPRKNAHMKRSPNHRTRPKQEQPYRFESLLPPPKQLKTFPKKIQYQQAFNVQPQYQFAQGDAGPIVGQHYQPLPIPQRYNTQQYSTIPLGIQYVQPSFLPQPSPINNTILQHPAQGVIKPDLGRAPQIQNINLSSDPRPTEDKESVQLLYVPLEQLQKQQNVNGGILDQAFKSLQQHKLVSQPQGAILQKQTQNNQQIFLDKPNYQQQLNQQIVLNQQQQSALPTLPLSQNQQQNLKSSVPTLPTQKLVPQVEEKPTALPLVSQNPQQIFLENPRYQLIQDVSSQKQEAQAHFELISKNRGELILQNNPKTVHVSNKQQFQVQSEPQKIIELTSEEPRQPQHILQHPKLQEPQTQQTQTQFIPRLPQSHFGQQGFQAQQPYRFQNQPQTQNNINYFPQDAQKARLESIQRDILQQTLEVEKLQKQIQQGKSIDFQTKNTAQPPKKRKPHQPPLAVYMEGSNKGDIEAVLDILKNAKSIVVQDQIGPDSPQVFVAPLNYREPDGYSKIPLPSPHVGSVVISKLNSRPNLNHLDSLEEPNRPVAITNYKFVNPSLDSTLENNSNFDDNLNVYSLESSGPRLSPNRQLKEQTLFQQINGFSGFEFPQSQYFPELNPQPELKTPDQEFVDIQPEHRKPIPSRNRDRGESSRGSKKSNVSLKDASQIEENNQSTRIEPGVRFQETSPGISEKPEKVEISTQTPLTQEFLNRFGSNNIQNYNFVSTAPEYRPTPQSNIEEIPANIRKLNVRPSQNLPTDSKFEQTLEELQNQNTPVISVDNKANEQNRQQYELPVQLTNINPNLPGLINGLEAQDQPTTTFRYETNPVVTSRPISSTQVTTQSTEATTTTRRSRGRGRTRFNVRTSTSPPSRRPSSERRPAKIINEEESYRVNTHQSVDSERIRPRGRLQNTLSERVSEASVESTTPRQLFQPTTHVMDISQNQPNYFMQFQSTIDNEKPIVNQNDFEPQAGVQVVEQYQVQKVTPAEQLPPQREEQVPIRQISEIPHKVAVTPQPTETEKPTRRRVRVRGRPKTTTTPRPTNPSPPNEPTEFYGFTRQPNFSHSSQINNHKEEEPNIHIYAPIQQKTSPVYVQKTYEPIVTSSPRSDTDTTLRFVGELRPKYASPSRSTTTTEAPSSQRIRTRGRVRVPGRTYESRTSSQEVQTTERNNRGRSRGRTHFTPPRNTRQEETDETENYPASYLRTKEISVTPSYAEFQITVEGGDEKDDQIPHSTNNRAEKFKGNTEATSPIPQINEDEKNYIEKEEESPSKNLEVMSFRKEKMKQEGFKVVNIDQFDTAESQNYRSLFNSIGDPSKVNDLRSKENEDSLTENPMSLFEKELLGLMEPDPTGSSQSVSTAEAIKTTSDDSMYAEALRNTTETSTIPPTTSTTTEESEMDVSSTIATDSSEGGEITSTIPPEEELKMSTSTDTSKSTVQTALDLLALQTSTSTEISHETEICYKGRCVKSRNKKLRRPSS